jgi:polar amino acid transport system substrate-binding protein
MEYLTPRETRCASDMTCRLFHNALRRILKSWLVVGLALISGWSTASISAADRPLVVAVEDGTVWPWIIPVREPKPGLPPVVGVTVEQMQAVAADCGLRIEWRVLPWKRALYLLEQQQVDAVVEISYNQERSAYAVFPLRESVVPGSATPVMVPDESLALHVNTYRLIRRRGDRLSWDGVQFSGLTGPIASQPGFSIGSWLRGLGVTVDETSKDPDIILAKLEKGRIQGAALLDGALELAYKQQPKFWDSLEVHALSLQEKPYYLAFSKNYARANPQTIERIWRAVAKYRQPVSTDSSLGGSTTKTDAATP